MGQRDGVKGVGAKGGMLVEVHHGHSRRLREDFALASEFFDVIIPSHREACAGLLLCQEPCPPAWGGAAMRAAARAWGGRVVGLKRLGFSVCRRQRRQQRGAFVPRQTLQRLASGNTRRNTSAGAGEGSRGAGQPPSAPGQWEHEREHEPVRVSAAEAQGSRASKEGRGG